jgi:hypothetical protein
MRRALVFRVVVTCGFLALFVNSFFVRSFWGGLIFGAFAGIEAAVAVLLIVAYRRAGPEQLAALIERSPRMSLRYLQPNKYPYVAPPTLPGDSEHQVNSALTERY